MSPTTVVVGTSIGGVRTAQALRATGYQGRVLLVGQESELPYDKPPLSKAFLGAAHTVEQNPLLTEREASAGDIELLSGRRAHRLDLAAGAVEFDNHPPINFDNLVIATGARARPAPWGSRTGVHVLRTQRQAAALRADLDRGGHLVVIGAGFIGAEVAATARQRGLEVTLVDTLPGPLYRVVGAELAERFGALHRDHGTQTLFEVGVAGIDGEQGNLRVQLTDGRVLSADTVVVGIGSQLNDDWLKSSGLVIDDGVVCDEYCRSVTTDQVFAVGDIARWFHTGLGELVRVEHWTNAGSQAACVANNIAHPDDLQSYQPTQYIWSDQYDWRIGIVGQVSGEYESLLTDDGGTRFVALYGCRDGLLAGAVVVNWPRALMQCRRAVENRESFAEVSGLITGEADRRSFAAREFQPQIGPR